jgi:hypothetical protein
MPPPDGTSVAQAPTTSADTQASTLPAESEQARFKVVGLPSWHQTQQVIITDKSNGQVYYFKPGDEIIGGRIAMVDYRPLSRRDQPLINSSSRVIIAIGGEFYGVELGQTLAERVKVEATDLPVALVSSVQSVHAADSAQAPAPVTAPAPGPTSGPSSGPSSGLGTGATSHADSTPPSQKTDNH